MGYGRGSAPETSRGGAVARTPGLSHPTFGHLRQEDTLVAFDDLLDDVESVLADPAGQNDGRTVDELRVAPNVVDRQIALPQVEDAPQLRLRFLGESRLGESDSKDLHSAVVIGHVCREPERPALRKTLPAADCLTSVATRCPSTRASLRQPDGRWSGVRLPVDNGCFSAWWPTDEEVITIVTLDAAGSDMVAVQCKPSSVTTIFGSQASE